MSGGMEGFQGMLASFQVGQDHGLEYPPGLDESHEGRRGGPILSPDVR